MHPDTSDINFHVTDWNFIYKIWISYSAVPVVLYAHVSVEIKVSPIWEKKMPIWDQAWHDDLTKDNSHRDYSHVTAMVAQM